MPNIDEVVRQERKAEILAMPRKELNGHAYLLEQEQNEYAEQVRLLIEEIEQQEDKYKEHLRVLIQADHAKICNLQYKAAKQDKEIQTLKDSITIALEALGHIENGVVGKRSSELATEAIDRINLI